MFANKQSQVPQYQSGRQVSFRKVVLSECAKLIESDQWQWKSRMNFLGLQPYRVKLDKKRGMFFRTRTTNVGLELSFGLLSETRGGGSNFL